MSTSPVSLPFADAPLFLLFLLLLPILALKVRPTHMLVLPIPGGPAISTAIPGHMAPEQPEDGDVEDSEACRPIKASRACDRVEKRGRVSDGTRSIAVPP